VVEGRVTTNLQLEILPENLCHVAKSDLFSLTTFPPNKFSIMDDKSHLSHLAILLSIGRLPKVPTQVSVRVVI
jgi:hypothetical protein